MKLWPAGLLIILFFDEWFNLIDVADDGVKQVQVASSVTASGAQLSQLNIKAPRNGYVYAYLSNRSDQNVYFDNFKVTINTGNIIEENHYYSYGLKIAAISSRKLPDANEGTIKNDNLYNDKELWDDGDLNWYDYGFRNYDPQIGRFTQLDPLTWEYPHYAPYQFAGNDPIANIDIDGLEDFNVTGVGANLMSGATIGSKAFLASLNKTTSVISSVSNATRSLRPILTATSITIHTASTASNILNNGFANRNELNFSKPTVITDMNTFTMNNLMQVTQNKPENIIDKTSISANSSTPWIKTAEIEFNKKVKEAYDVTKIRKGKILIEGCNCGEDVEKYLKAVGLGAGYPWCAAFINWDMKQNNISGSRSALALSFEKWGQQLSKPAFGSIGIIDHSDGTGHVTIIVGQSMDGSMLIGLGGNQGNKVQYSSYPRSNFKGFRYPNGYSPSYNLPKMKIQGGVPTDR